MKIPERGLDGAEEADSDGWVGGFWGQIGMDGRVRTIPEVSPVLAH